MTRSTVGILRSVARTSTIIPVFSRIQEGQKLIAHRTFNDAAKRSVSSQKVRANTVIAREPKRLRQSPNRIAASLSAPRNDICFNKMYLMHGVIEILQGSQPQLLLSVALSSGLRLIVS